MFAQQRSNVWGREHGWQETGQEEANSEMLGRQGYHDCGQSSENK
jgi:hypothetical protein